jgi:hypothetical protein
MSKFQSLGYYELKKHKPWFDKMCSELLDQRKQAKLQWLQYPSDINGNNLNKVRWKASIHLRNKKRELGSLTFYNPIDLHGLLRR